MQKRTSRIATFMLTFLLLLTACQEKNVGQDSPGKQVSEKIPVMDYEQKNELNQDEQEDSLTTEAIGDEGILAGAISIEGRSGGGSTVEKAIERRKERPIVDTLEPEVEEVTLPAEEPTADEGTQAQADRPKLMLKGLSLQSSQADVIQKLSSPLDQYTMQDPQGELTVFEYDGFTIGLNSNERIIFIELYGVGQDSELHGIKIGHSRDVVKSALGQPQSENEYMITYQSEQTILRFDTDPIEHSIHAIKLFLAE